MTKLHELNQLGQSIWLDHIRRSLLESGELQALIDDGLRGMTSNPSIFQEAIGESGDYDDQFSRLATGDMSALDIYEALAIDDIQHAADLFLPVYEKSNGDDGYVSLEANPHLADDTQGTISEIIRLHDRVDRPNVMFKVPATSAGIPAIEQLISKGININITLMFSMKHYNNVIDAYITGLESRLNTDASVSDIASVASFFVSRVDSKLDPRLENMGLDQLVGTIGIANAKNVYQRFTQVLNSARWRRLADAGARVQRVLWGSTSTKNPKYSDTLYVDNLIGPHTVNTVPPRTLEAFRDHGTVARTVDQNITEARTQVEQLRKGGIDLDAIGDELQEEGVEKFIDAFEELLDAITEKRETLQSA